MAEIEFTEWTKDKHLRHPSFKGLRLDKQAADIKREDPQSDRVVLTHPEKILYPEDGYTKQDLLTYYEHVKDYLLPFIKNRPISVVRCPETYEHCFFQRHVHASTPKTLKSIDIETKDKTEPYIYLDDEAGLLGLVQMSVLEIHPWGSLISSLETPDWVIFDLDPAPDVTWKALVSAALDIKQALEKLNLASFVKTTGGKGLHVVIPILPEYDWEKIKNFTHVFVLYLEKRSPDRYISNMKKSKRGGKIFVDYLRNQRGATAVSAYSTRARLHAPISVPLTWDELTKMRKYPLFTLKTLPKRLAALKSDPWEDFWIIKQHLPDLDF